MESLDVLGRDYVDLRDDEILLRDITAQPRKLMWRLKQKGLATTVQNGRYLVYRDRRPRPASRPRVRSLEPLAADVLRRLDHEYFLSWHSALWHHRLVEQQSRRLYVAVNGARKRDAKVGSWTLQFVTLRPGRFFGAEPSSVDGRDVWIATVERAIVDAFDQPELAGDGTTAPTALRSAHRRGRLSPETLVKLALRLDQPSLNRRLGFFMDRYGIPGAEALRAHLGRRHAVALAAGIDPEAGAVDSRWGVRLNRELLAAADRPK
jgi:predicted transcriptional regulator of viral defense system